MSEHLPPNENLSIFNPDNFILDSSSLTVSEANGLYIKLSGGTILGDIRMNDSKQLFFGNSTDYISNISSNLTLNSAIQTNLTGGALVITNSNAYTVANTGALILPSTSGGGCYIHGNSAFGSHLSILNTDASTSSITGALQISGGIYSGAASFFNSNLTINGSAGLTLSNSSAQVQVNNLRSTTSNVINMFPLTNNATGTMIAQISPSSSGWSSTGIARLQFGDSSNYIQAVNGTGIFVETNHGFNINASDGSFFSGNTVTMTPYLICNGSNNQTQSFAYLNSSGSVGTSTSSANYSIKALNRIVCSEINVVSSKLRKRIIEEKISQNTLDDLKAKFQALKLSKYQYIDVLQDGNDTYYGLIAEDVYSNFNQYMDDAFEEYTPNIYSGGVVENINDDSGVIRLTQNPIDMSLIPNNGKLLAYDINGKTIILHGCIITSPYQDMWTIEFSSYESEVVLSNNLNLFVYGDQRYIPNLNKNAIFEIGLCLLQSYISKVDDMNSKLNLINDALHLW